MRLKDQISKVIGQEGIKTDVVVTLTTTTVVKAALGLIAAGTVTAVVWHLVKSKVKNRQLAAIQQQIQTLTQHLST